MKDIKKTLIAISIIAVFTFSTIQTPNVNSKESTVKDLLSQYLCEVAEIDVTKYNLTVNGYESNFPLLFDGLVEEEVLYCTLESNEDKISILCIFDNGKIAMCTYRPNTGALISNKLQSNDVIALTKNIIGGYSDYASTDQAKNTYILEAKNILNGVNKLEPINITENNMNFQILTYEDHTTLKWVYLENDVPMEYKKIQLDFHNNTFLTLIDTWTLYSVGNFSRISANQAVQVGRAAAKKLDLSIVENDSTITKPELSDSIYDVSLSMVPGNILNANPPEAPSSNIPSKVARDPLALYPLWQLHFYFTEKVGDILGIEVGVWGDSEEIAYCEDFGLLGISELSGSQTAPPSTPVITPSASQKLEIPEVQTMDEQNNPNYLNQILLATVSLTALSIAISLFALRKKNKRK